MQQGHAAAAAAATAAVAATAGDALARLARLEEETAARGRAQAQLVREQGQRAPPFGSAPARLLCLLTARLAALGSSSQPGGEAWAHWAPRHCLGCSS